MGTQRASAPATESPETPYPSPRYAWYVVGVLTLMYVFSFIDRQIFALIVGRFVAISRSPTRRSVSCKVSSLRRSTLFAASRWDAWPISTAGAGSSLAGSWHGAD